LFSYALTVKVAYRRVEKYCFIKKRPELESENGLLWRSPLNDLDTIIVVIQCRTRREIGAVELFHFKHEAESLFR
jgi:cytochrome c-type biogenesis protein CcmH/NrfF